MAYNNGTNTTPTGICIYGQWSVAGMDLILIMELHKDGLLMGCNHQTNLVVLYISIGDTMVLDITHIRQTSDKNPSSSHHLMVSNH